jgi:hypothetical protein
MRRGNAVALQKFLGKALAGFKLRGVNSSTTPSISGNSGPTIVRSGWIRFASAIIESRLFTSTATHSASSAIPPLPGAQ